MSTDTEASGRMTVAKGRSWWALDLFVSELAPSGGSGLVVAEAIVPEGASPPLHVHEDLDDDFYILEGRAVVRCGDRVWVAGAGDWVAFPMGVPHTFRIVGGPARVLLVHNNDSFMSVIRDLGEPASADTLPTPTGGPGMDAVSRAMAAHGISVIGPCLEADEAEALLESLAERERG